MPSAITVTRLSKRYRLGRAVRATVLGRRARRTKEEVWALRDVSFEVGRGEVLGIIGRNGAGKSTLLKVLARITEPTAGRAVLSGRVGSLLEVGTGFHNELTGRENVYLSGAILGMKRAQINARFDEIVEFSGVERFLDTPVKRYSSGMRVRLAFAVAAHLEPEILLVDEVLAVGDAAFQQKCLGKMESLEQGGRTVLFVSHNMASVRHLCTQCLWLDGGRIAASGEVDRVVDAYLESAAPAQAAGARYGLHVQAPEPLPAAYLTRLELLDAAGAALRELGTGEPCRVRIGFHCAQSGTYSIYFGIQSADAVQLIGYGMNDPDGVVLHCEPGEHSVEVEFPTLPLAAGTYWAGAGISHPGVQWLHRLPRIGRFEVAARDVFGSGRPVSAQSSLLCIAHRWRVPPSEGGIEIVQ